jgi:hypothetical protein
MVAGAAAILVGFRGRAPAPGQTAAGA